MAKKRKHFNQLKNKKNSNELYSLLVKLCLLAPPAVMFFIFLYRMFFQDEIEFVLPAQADDTHAGSFELANIEQPTSLTPMQAAVVEYVQGLWYSMFGLVLPYYRSSFYRDITSIGGRDRGVLWARCGDGSNAVYVLHPHNLDFLEDGGIRFRSTARIMVVHDLPDQEKIQFKMQTAGQICVMGEGHSISEMANLFNSHRAKFVTKKGGGTKKSKKGALRAEFKVNDDDDADLKKEASEVNEEELDLLGTYEF